MIDPELIRGMVAMHHYPTSAEHLAELAARYPSVRADADALGQLMGNSDFPPYARFNASPDRPPQT